MTWHGSALQLSGHSLPASNPATGHSICLSSSETVGTRRGHVTHDEGEDLWCDIPRYIFSSDNTL